MVAFHMYIAGPVPKKYEHEQTARLEKVMDFVEEQEIRARELGQARVKLKIQRCKWATVLKMRTPLL